MKQIELTNGGTVLLSDEDYEWASEIKWHARRAPRSTYARIMRWCNGKKIAIHLHREIMAKIIGRPLETHEHIDHINHNGLDNQRENLRICSLTENSWHQRKQKSPASSRYKGVTWHTRDHHWQASIKAGGKCRYLGAFPDEVQAAKAYDAAATDLHGEFACLNLPDQASSHS